MDNLIQLAMQMMFCLLIAAILGAIIGYLLGKMSKCDKEDYEYEKKDLNDYESEESLAPQAAISIGSAQAVNKIDTDMQVGQEVGSRPSIITDPDQSQRDDLKEISGIGLKIEEALNNLGIYSFEQIANWNFENIEWIENYLVFKGRIKKEDWIGQAKLLFAGGETEFSKKVKKGENPNY